MTYQKAFFESSTQDLYLDKRYVKGSKPVFVTVRRGAISTKGDTDLLSTLNIQLPSHSSIEEPAL